MLKKLVALVLGLVLVSGVPALAADQFTLGGVWVQGAHSDDGKYSMNNGGSDLSWGVMLSYDKDLKWKKQVNNNNALGIDPGLTYLYLRWDKGNNAYREVCSPRYFTSGDCEVAWNDCENEKYKKSTESVDSHFGFVTLKPYWEIHKDFRLFAHMGIGYEVSNGSKNEDAVMGGAGMQYMWNKNLGTSLAWYEVYSNPTGAYKRWDAVVLSGVLTF